MTESGDKQKIRFGSDGWRGEGCDNQVDRDCEDNRGWQVEQWRWTGLKQERIFSRKGGRCQANRLLALSGQLIAYNCQHARMGQARTNT